MRRAWCVTRFEYGDDQMLIQFSNNGRTRTFRKRVEPIVHGEEVDLRAAVGKALEDWGAWMRAEGQNNAPMDGVER